MTRRAVVVTAWSVLTFLLLSKEAIANTPQIAAIRAEANSLRLNQFDSFTLFNRIMLPKTIEKSTRGTNIAVKRFSSADSAVRLVCAQSLIERPDVGTLCAVSLVPSVAQPSVSEVQSGFLLNSTVFRIKEKSDVQKVLLNVLKSEKFESRESVQYTDQFGKLVQVPRFTLDCPPDWVFEVVYCEGHIVGR